MSILLESLVGSHSRSNTSKDAGIPNVSDSHFDDEMLGDEWLLASVRFWKRLTISLALLLLLVLLSVYLLWPKTRLDVGQPNNVLIAVTQTEISHATESSPTARMQASPHSELVDLDPSSDAASNLKPKIAGGEKTDTLRTKYQPKIVKPISDVNTTSVSSKPNVQSTFKPAASASDATPINYESLSEEEKQQIPALRINSYAVSSNPSKSFVVLNDAFYGQGETIAPHLVLVLIDDKGIVVKYNGRLIRKKYDL